MLTFTGITIWRVRFPFRMAFSHNLASRTGADTLLVELTASTGHAGHGQILPRAYLTGESLDTALAAIQGDLWPRLRGLDLPSSGGEPAWLEAMLPLYRHADATGRTAAWAGLDVAAWHAWARATGEPAAAAPTPLVGVVPAMGPRKAWALARLYRWLGFRHVKVKVGRDAAADAARVAAVRRAIGPDGWLAADANAAWSLDEAAGRMRALAAQGVAVVEEPLAPGEGGADRRRLEAATGVAVMADESLCTRADAQALAADGGPSWWNLRLAKNGGLSGYRALAGMAREAGARVYGGILVGETGVLAAAAGRAWADASCAMGEYGFSRAFLRGDPFRGAPAGYAGVLRPGAADGPALRRDVLLRVGAEAVFTDDIA